MCLLKNQTSIKVISSSKLLCNACTAIVLLQAEGNTFNEAYGRILGTQITCCWLAVLLSFMPPRMLKRCFPPMVTGVTIFLIGAGLIGEGLKVGSKLPTLVWT